MGHLQSNHEEAYTKIILHAVDATDNDVTELSIYSPDIDVLLIAVRRYPGMCPDKFCNWFRKTSSHNQAKTNFRGTWTRLVGKNSKIRMSLALELYPIWVHKRSQTKKL